MARVSGRAQEKPLPGDWQRFFYAHRSANRQLQAVWRGYGVRGVGDGGYVGVPSDHPQRKRQREQDRRTGVEARDCVALLLALLDVEPDEVVGAIRTTLPSLLGFGLTTVSTSALLLLGQPCWEKVTLPASSTHLVIVAACAVVVTSKAA